MSSQLTLWVNYSLCLLLLRITTQPGVAGTKPRSDRLGARASCPQRGRDALVPPVVDSFVTVYRTSRIRDYCFRRSSCCPRPISDALRLPGNGPFNPAAGRREQFPLLRAAVQGEQPLHGGRVGLQPAVRQDVSDRKPPSRECLRYQQSAMTVQRFLLRTHERRGSTTGVLNNPIQSLPKRRSRRDSVVADAPVLVAGRVIRPAAQLHPEGTTYSIPHAVTLRASDSRLNCGLKRLYGVERTSITLVTS